MQRRTDPDLILAENAAEKKSLPTFLDSVVPVRPSKGSPKKQLKNVGHRPYCISTANTVSINSLNALLPTAKPAAPKKKTGTLSLDNRVIKWLKELDEEASSFNSNILYTEMLLNKTAAVTTKHAHSEKTITPRKDVGPNALRTAMALHALSRTSTVLGKPYEHVMKRLVSELESSIYVESASSSSTLETSAAEAFCNRGITFFDQCHLLSEEVQRLTAENKELEESQRSVNSKLKKMSANNLIKRRTAITNDELASQGRKSSAKVDLQENKVVVNEEDENDVSVMIKLYDNLAVNQRFEFNSHVLETSKKAISKDDMVSLIQKMEDSEKSQLMSHLFKQYQDTPSSSRKASAAVVSNIAVHDKSKHYLGKLRTALTDLFSGLHISALDPSGPDEEAIIKVGELIDRESRNVEVIAELKASIEELLSRPNPLEPIIEKHVEKYESLEYRHEILQLELANLKEKSNNLV